MKKFRIYIFVLLLVGCGSSDSLTKSNSDITSNGADVLEINDKEKAYFIAKDNSFHDVNRTFKDFNVVVYSSRELNETLSNSTKAVYGNINGENTTSLLSINSHYRDGDTFIIKVLSGATNVGESQEVQLHGDILDFGNIISKSEKK